MNRNNYQLGSNNHDLNVEAEMWMKDIEFLSNERNFHNHFPTFSTIEYRDVEEIALIERITLLESIYAKAGSVHHNAHLYYLEETSNGFRVMHNDMEYACDGGSTSPPVCSGKTAIDCLKRAWNNWSIPPVLILNADYYVPEITIKEVI